MKQFFYPLFAGFCILLLCSGSFAVYHSAGKKITVISNPDKVEKIKAEMVVKIEMRKQEKLRKMTLPEKYKSGDRSVVPEMILVLKGNDADAKQTIYNGLSKNFEDPGDYAIREPELIDAIFANIYKPDDEGSAIQLAGNSELPGYIKKFEEHLFSGKTRDSARLIYWLSQDGSSVKVLELLRNKIMEKEQSVEAMGDLIYSLKGFAVSKDPAIREMTVSLALEIYNNKMIPVEKFEDLKISWASDNPAYPLLDILFDHGDARVLPIAHDMLKRDIESWKALNAIARLEGIAQKDLLFRHMRNIDQFYNTLTAAVIMYKGSKDESIPKELLKQLDEIKEYQFHKIGWVVDALMEMNAATYLETPQKFISDPKTVALVKEYYVLAKGTPASFAEDLYKMGVVDRPFDKSVVDKANKRLADNEYRNSTSYMHDFLNVSGIYTTTYAESWESPLAYDDMIAQFTANSNGKLAGTLIWMETTAKSEDRYKYKVTVATADKVYVIEPEDNGYLFEMELVLELVNKILSDAGMKEKFTTVTGEDGYTELVFGPAEQVNAMMKKYHLLYE